MGKKQLINESKRTSGARAKERAMTTSNILLKVSANSIVQVIRIDMIKDKIIIS